MASPQTENGFTKISNELLEVLSRTKLTGSQFAMIMCIMRKTYGFNKKEDKISISQFVKMLGLSKRAVIYNLQDLEAKSIILVKRGGKGLEKEVNIITLNKDYDTWVVDESASQVEKNRGSAKLRKQEGGSAKLGKKVVQNSVKSLPSFAHTKETITKERTKETTSELSSQAIVSVIDAFVVFNKAAKTWYGNKTQRASIARLLEEYGQETVLKVVSLLPQVNTRQYFPTITTPYQLEQKWVQLEAAFVRYQKETNTPVVW